MDAVRTVVQPEARQLGGVCVVDKTDVRRGSDLLAQHALRRNGRRWRVERSAVDVRRICDAEEIRMSVKCIGQKSSSDQQTKTKMEK